MIIDIHTWFRRNVGAGPEKKILTLSIRGSYSGGLHLVFYDIYEFNIPAAKQVTFHLPLVQAPDTKFAWGSEILKIKAQFFYCKCSEFEL